MFSKIFTLMSLFVVLGLGLSGCGTIGGAGSDIKSAGGAIEDAAD